MRKEEGGKYKQDLRLRTKQFALRVIRAYAVLQKRDEVQQTIGRQMIRSGTSLGAQYREACRARSGAEFVSKLNSALQELDETAYWFELLVDSGSMSPAKLGPSMNEADELIAIFVKCIKNTKAA